MVLGCIKSRRNDSLYSDLISLPDSSCSLYLGANSFFYHRYLSEGGVMDDSYFRRKHEYKFYCDSIMCCERVNYYIQDSCHLSDSWRRCSEGKFLMYAALWRMLPGGVFLKLIQLTIILVIAVFVLFEWVFPWLAQTFLSEQSTVE